MIKGRLSLLGMFGVFQAPKERGKGSEVNRFLEEQMLPGAGLVPSSSCSANCGHPHPYVETGPPKVEKPEGWGRALEPEQGAGGPES